MRARSTPLIQSPPPLKKLLQTAEWLDFLEPNMSQISTYARSATANDNTFGIRNDTGNPSSLQDLGCRTEILELPDWVPSAIKDRVSGIYNDVCDQSVADDRLNLLLRLARDRRMKTAWVELYKTRWTKEDTKQFFYPPRFWLIGYAKAWRWKAAQLRIPPGEPSEKIVQIGIELGRSITIPEEPIDPQERQDLAVQYLLHHAYLSALVDSTTLSESEVKNLREEHKSCAGRLRTEADQLRSFGMEAEAEELIRIALQCESNTTSFFNRWFVARRADNRLRGYVFTLAKLNQILFGTPMYGVLAIIANVAFDRTEEITGLQIREMLRGPALRILTSGSRPPGSMGFSDRPAAI